MEEEEEEGGGGGGGRGGGGKLRSGVNSDKSNILDKSRR
jgi:hypothetical protein